MLALNQAFKNIGVKHFSTFFVNFHQTSECFFLSFWRQTTKMIGKCFWKHWNHFLWQINTRTARASFVIDWRFFCDKMAYIRDVHAE